MTKNHSHHQLIAPQLFTSRRLVVFSLRSLPSRVAAPRHPSHPPPVTQQAPWQINERIQTRTTTNNTIQRLTGLVIAALCLTCTRWLKLWQSDLNFTEYFSHCEENVWKIQLNHCYLVLAVDWRLSVAGWCSGMFASCCDCGSSCLLAQHNVLQYYQLVSISCHFRDWCTE